MKTPKPNWWLLYSLLPFAVTLLAAADLLPQSAGWRQAAEGLAALTVVGAMALWVRANRVALALLDCPSVAGTPVRAWVAYQPPAASRRRLSVAESESRQRIAVQRTRIVTAPWAVTIRRQ